MGTIFSFYDNGKNPKKTNNANEIRNQLGVVTYVLELIKKDI